jgi:hypothetical protein
LVVAFASAIGGKAVAQNSALFIPVPGNQLANPTEQQSQALASLRTLPTTASVDLVGVNVDVLQGDTISLMLPGLGAVQATRRRTITHGASDYTWIGDLRGIGGQAILVVKNGDITGHIQSGANIYSVTPLGGGIHALARINQSMFPADHPRPPPVAPQSGRNASPPTAAQDVGADGLQVDILVAYTTLAKNAQGGNMAAFAQLAVDAANTAYNNSNANVSLRLVGTMEISGYSEAGSTFDAVLCDVTNQSVSSAGCSITNNAAMAAVRTRRDQVGADLVAVILDRQSTTQTSVCGLAWINSSVNFAFATVAWDCAVGNYSFAHEIGHNFGSRHEPESDPTTTPFAYGHGYRNCNTFRTIMATSDPNCPRIQYFSNPNITFNGAPTGTASLHDSARVHRERVSTIAAFRTSVVPSGIAPHDFDGGGKSDIAWRDSTGSAALWLMNGGAISSSGGIGNVPTSWSIVGQRDFNGDGKHDLLWRDTSGNTAIWFLNGLQVTSSGGIGNVPTTWAVAGTADFNGDGKGDILWRNTTGDTAIWLMNGAQVSSSASIGTIPTVWSVAGAADFNGDGKADILWRDTSGNTAIWLMNGTQVSSTGNLGNVPTSWTVVATADFDGNGRADILWRDSSGNTAIWFMNGAAISSTAGIGAVSTTWSVKETGDFNGDGKADILWRDTGGNTAIWFMNGPAISSTAGLGVISTSWTIQATNVD